jgi:hypothetical protein
MVTGATKPGSFITIADVDGTKPHRYPLALDFKTGELAWNEQTDPDQRDNDGNPIIPGTLVSKTWQRFDGGMGHNVEDGENGYYFAENWRVTPWAIKPRPTITSVTLTGNAVPPERMFEAASASGTKYLYSLAGTKVFKVRLSDKALVNTKNFGVGSINAASGSYVGTGTTNPVTSSLLFTPKLIVIRPPLASSSPVFKTDNLTAAYDYKVVSGAYSTGSTSDGIAIETAGFTLYGSAAAFNAVGTQYTWWAIGGDAAYVKTGSFSGDAVDNTDITIGAAWGQPDALFIFTNNSSDPICFRIKTDTADRTKDLSLATTPPANLVQATAGWPVDGFEVGSDNRVNRSGATVFYVALKELANVLDIDTYTGNGVDNRSITTPNFEPDLALIYSAGGTGGVFRTDSHAGDSYSFFLTALDSFNGIQAFESTGFQVGSGGYVNTDTIVHYYLVIRQDPAINSTFGHPDEWNSIWHLPCGQNVYFKRLTSIVDGTGDDTWTASALYADHFCAAGNLFFRINGRVIDSCSAPDTTVAGNWSGDYNVGRVGETFNDLIAVGDELGVCSDRNFYLFDAVSVARPRLGKDKPALSDNGKGVVQFYEWTLLPYGGYYRYYLGGAIPVGPDSINGYTAVDGISNEPVKLTHYGSDYSENIVYNVAKDAQSTPVYHLFMARREAEGLIWDTLLQTTTAMKVVFIDSTRVCWVSYGNNVFYITLDAEGLPDGGTFGEATFLTNNKFFLPEWDAGTTAMKRLIAYEVHMRNDAGNITFAVGSQRDAGTPAAVGGVTENGINEVFFTPGTSDTCRRLRPYLTWSAVGYAPSATPPEIFCVTLRAELRPEQGDVIKAGVILETDKDGTAEGKWARLKAMASAATAKKVWDSDGNIIYTTVVNAQQTEIRDKDGTAKKGAVLFLRRSAIA